MIQKKHILTLARILALVAVIGISIFVYSIRDRAEEFAVYGYPGIFIIENDTTLVKFDGSAGS